MDKMRNETNRDKRDREIFGNHVLYFPVNKVSEAITIE